MEFVSKMIDIAAGEVGVKEVPKGSNKGPRVSEYQRRTGYGTPVPWCLCFLYWCADEACNAMDVHNEILRTGSCDLILAWAREHRCLFDDPKPGDWGLVTKTSTDATHVFLVKEFANGRLTTIEGNTNSDGSREGYAVVQRSRPCLKSYRYVRAGHVLPAEDAAPETLTLFAPNGADIGQMPLIRGSARAPIRDVAKALGIRKDGAVQPVVDEEIGWDANRQAVTIAGRHYPDQILLLDGVSYAPIRTLVGFLGWDVEFDAATRSVRVVNP